MLSNSVETPPLEDIEPTVDTQSINWVDQTNINLQHKTNIEIDVRRHFDVDFFCVNVPTWSILSIFGTSNLYLGRPNSITPKPQAFLQEYYDLHNFQ